jgi:hypothetical protein
MTLEELKLKETELREIWLANREKKSLDLFKCFGDYFDVASGVRYEGASGPKKDWIHFMVFHRKFLREWQEEHRDEIVEKKLSKMDDEEIDELQDTNRKRMILMLKEVLDDYDRANEGGKKKLMKLDISQIRQLYTSIQTLEERKKMTAISKGKLGLETVKTFLPYQRLSIEEILQLKEKINESIERIVQTKTGEPVRLLQ